VGAWQEDSAATGIDGDQSDNSLDPAGAVYVFTRDEAGVWSQQAYIKASNTDRDSFGKSVALSGDTLAVGAVGESSGATGVNGDQADNSRGGAGAVYVFTRNESSEWSQQAYIKASNTDSDPRYWNDEFGYSVALDGDALAVSAIGEDSQATGINGDQTGNNSDESGAVYLFTRDASGTWSQQAYVKASNTGFSRSFGRSVELNGDTLAVGAWDRSGATGINGDQTDTSAFGAGAVYVFR
jgi:hypothetical protein